LCIWKLKREKSRQEAEMKQTNDRQEAAAEMEARKVRGEAIERQSGCQR
jgi:hypothetical protein